MYKIPVVNIEERKESDDSAILETAGKLNMILNSFGISGRVAKYSDGARLVRFYIMLSPGVKFSKLKSILPNLEYVFGSGVSLAEPSTSGETMGLFGIDIPKQDIRLVTFGNFRANWSGASTAAFALGENMIGDGVVCDLSKMPHLLIAGASGSGKSVCINSIIASILYRNVPEACRLILIDPKQVELSVYEGIPHLLRPIAKSTSEALSALAYVQNVMDSRYKDFKAAGVRNIEEYNESHKTAKYGRIVVVIDELADLMLTAKYQVEPIIVRLAQLARAAGIHLVVATQEPTCTVISGLIKANMPSRIAFATATSKESVVILGHGGAEKLLGKGDMLFKSNDSAKPIRVQGLFVSSEEINQVVSFIRDQNYIPFAS